MAELDPTGSASTVSLLIMHLLFHVADMSDACQWASRARSNLSAGTNPIPLDESDGLDDLEWFDATLSQTSDYGAGLAPATHSWRANWVEVNFAMDFLHPAAMWGRSLGKYQHGTSEKLAIVTFLPSSVSGILASP
ncbi:hypothetical protein HBI60_228060 [Parastagonospora nodorum]|nr:hypothetical protein HBH82_230980 [Parastagonospora nodorum]KAH4661480.1 hypothetical protein HBH78_223010 [Parastagonospora nodorum]KAH4691661.1 hypothetical protein HBH67_239220 [Parastagonospora nodorum]KAH4755710.1 hypothetical protein HBH63_230510 [Parastagonospora nodorum]KAH4769741.1 hypothetical protein HBH62_228450 [Parastagonospora nodorum]